MNRNSVYSMFEIGDWSYGNPEIMRWQEDATLKVGKFCSIADGVKILLGGEHHTEWVTTYPFWPFFPKVVKPPNHPFSKGNVVIGNDVWIGYGAIILSGVTIGDGAVIAAGSIVTRSVEPYAIVGGNPAKLIRKRFDDETITKLQTIAWWNWPLHQIMNNLDLLRSNNLKAIAEVKSHR